jgi:hypothetical protein
MTIRLLAVYQSNPESTRVLEPRASVYCTGQRHHGGCSPAPAHQTMASHDDAATRHVHIATWANFMLRIIKSAILFNDSAMGWGARAQGGTLKKRVKSEEALASEGAH